MPCIESFDMVWPSNSDFHYQTPFEIDNEEHRRIIRHLFRRLGFGASLEEIKWAEGKSINYIVNQLIGGVAGSNEFNAGAADIDLPTENGDELFNFSEGEERIPRRPKPDATLEDLQNNNLSVNGISPSYISELISYYWLNEALNGDEAKFHNYKPLQSTAGAVRAKLLLFWHSHFATQEDIETDLDKVNRYFKVLHRNAFGNFRDFVEEIGRTPMMLTYLSGHDSYGDPYFGGGQKQSSVHNENYARELLELFTMGPTDKDGVPNYSDEDIIHIARALTGWRVARYGNQHGNEVPNEDQLRFQFTSHDWNTVYGPKTISLGTNSSFQIDGYACWKAIFDENVSFTQYAEYWKLNNAPSPAGFTYDSAKPAPPLDSTFNSSSNDPVWRNAFDKGVVVDDAPTKTELSVYEDYLFNDGNSAPNTYYNSAMANLGKSILMAGTLQYRWIHHIIFNQKADEIAFFICRKLYEFYVFGDIEQIEDTASVKGFIEQLANVFKQNWEITDVLKALFKSRHFYDPGVIGAQIKSPIACVSSFFRSAGLKSGESPIYNGNQWVTAPGVDFTHRLEMVRTHVFNDANNHAPEFYDYVIGGSTHTLPHPNHNGGVVNRMTAEGMGTEPIGNASQSPMRIEFLNQRNLDTALIFRELNRMGQHLLNPPDVAGWPGHHNWLNEFTLISRWDLLTEVIDRFNRTWPTNGAATKEKLKTLTKELLVLKYGVNASNYYANCDAWIRELWAHFFSVEPTPNQLQEACFIFINGWPYGNFGPSLDAQDDGSIEMEGIDTAVTDRVIRVLAYFTKQPDFQLT